MSQAPSTLGTMITSSLSPISVTSWVMSSSTQGLSRLFTRVQRAVSPKSASRAGVDQPAARGLLAVHGHRVLEVAEQDVGLGGDLGGLGDHLLVREVEEVDHPRGREGDLAERLRGADGERLEEVTGVAHGPGRLLTCRAAISRLPRPMSETSTMGIETNQAEREASGAHPYGRYLEEFEVGAVYKHWPAKTVTEADDHLFCLITMNHHPLHINDVYAARVPAGAERGRGPARLLAGARHVGQRRVRARRSPTSPPRTSPTRRRSSTATPCSPRARCST